jgi:imidazolonepropionase-like amidohydrolase
MDESIWNLGGEGTTEVGEAEGVPSRPARDPGNEFYEARPPGAVLLVAERLLDGIGDDPVRGAAVLVEGGVIVAVGERQRLGAPDTAAVVDLGDRTLLPGLIDAHIHLFGIDVSNLDGMLTEPDAYRAARAARDLRRLLASGFTTVRCLGSAIGPELARAARERVIPSPRIVAAGQWICASGGTWDHLSVPLSFMTRADMFADGVDACREAVRRRIRNGARVIKVGLSASRPAENPEWSGVPFDHLRAMGMDPHSQQTAFTLEEARAIVDEAHAAGLRVSAHAIGDAPVSMALDAGVDVVEHGHGISDATRSRLAETRTPVVPTLSHTYLLVNNGPRYGVDRVVVELARNHRAVLRSDFRKALTEGVVIGSGSDMIGPPWAPLGRNAIEILLLANEGMSAAAALRSATSVNARIIGVDDDVGTLEPGKRADVVAVRGDPLSDLGCLYAMDFVMQDGVIVKSDGIDGMATALRWV